MNPHKLSIVVPVYQGERTLDALLAEIEPLVAPQVTPRGHLFRVVDVVLVHDGAVDGSHIVMERLAERLPFVTTVWLSRNYGQHAASLAGMAATTGDWVATVDEDGQMNPAELGLMLDAALHDAAPVVYAAPTNPPPHGFLRNLLSRSAKVAVARIVGNPQIVDFHSFRLVRGDIARSLAAYCGHGVYLDVALSWIVDSWTTCPVTLRGERERPSGYDFGKLFVHFGKLILTAGTRPLRLISIFGFLSIVVALVLSAVMVWLRLTRQIPVQGYTSLLVAMCFFSGGILFSLGVIAEYLAVTLSMAMGRPLFVTVSRPPGQDRPPS